MAKAQSKANGWVETSIKVNDLQLDPLNPRLLKPSEENTQRAICRELIERDEVEKLASDIAQQGYYPTEVLVVLKAPGGKYIVLEGNRRTAALKLLANPEFAPSQKQSKFEALKQEASGRVPELVRVVIAPSRIAARPLMLARHANPGIRKWSTVAQDRFVELMVSDGFTPQQIAQDMGIGVNDFVRRFREAKLYKLALSMNLSDEVRAIVEDPDKFPLTTLARIVDSVPGRTWLGMEQDDVSGWVIKSEAETFRKAFASIVSDVALKVVDSRKLVTTSLIEEYLAGKGRKKLKPKTRPGKPASMNAIIKPDNKKNLKPNTTAPRSTVTPPSSLLPGDVVCDLDCPRIHAIIAEIRQAERRTINAVGMLYRGLVDMAAQEYLDNTKQTKLLVAKFSGKGGSKPDDWMPSLPQMLRYLVKEVNLGLNPTAKRALTRFVDEQNTSISLAGLDGFAHNRYESPTTSQLEAIAERLRPLLAVLLQKPAP